MKHLPYIISLSLFAIFASCSNNDEPEYPAFMQPSVITTTDAKGLNQSFAYDDYGKIVDWSLKSNNPYYPEVYTAHYSYLGDNAIHIVSEESFGGHRRCFDETIHLVNGRASKSEGTFVSYIDGNVELKKSYRLEYEYDPSNHLNVVKHSEVVGIGDEIKGDGWNNPWTWENYYIWKDGLLIAFEDFHGKSTVYQTTKYDYSNEVVECPIVTPIVINNEHHSPLILQGVFGSYPRNYLVKALSVYDNKGNITFHRQYSYEFERARIIGYTESTGQNTVISNPVTYKVVWIEK